MKRKNKNYRPHRKKRTPEEYRQWLEEERKRLEFRLSHQKECFIHCVEQEERDLKSVIEELQDNGAIVLDDEDLRNEFLAKFR